jgi:predicted amidohydrolase
MDPVRVGVWQCEPSPGNPEANLASLEAALREPAAKGLDVLVAPEMFLTGWEPAVFRERSLSDPAWAQRLGAVARSHRVFLATSLLTVAGARRHNTFHLWGPDGALLGTQNKIHLWGREADALTPGTEPRSILAGFGRVGGIICYDVEFPEVGRALALQGAELFLVPAAFYSTTSWDIMTRARALENGCFLAAANQIGGDPSNPHNGQSRIVDPYGSVLAEVPSGQGGIAVASLDPKRIDAARKWAPFLRDLRLRAPTLSLRS